MQKINIDSDKLLPTLAETPVQRKCRELMESLVRDTMLYGRPPPHAGESITAAQFAVLKDDLYRDAYAGARTGRLPTTWSIQLQESAIISTVHNIEKALNNFAFTERRSAMIHEIMEIVIGQVGLTLAEQGGTAFDSFSFYAKVKGRPE